MVGAGKLGRVKSRGFNLLTRTILPPLSRFRDTNAPMKVFSADAARILVAEGRNPNVTMDCEWLMILHKRRVRVSAFPVVWTQRPGSRPPWHLIPASVRDLVTIRRRWHKPSP